MNRFDPIDTTKKITANKNRFNPQDVSVAPSTKSSAISSKITIPEYANPAIAKTDAIISKSKPESIVQQGLNKAQDIIWDIPVVNKILPIFTGGNKEELRDKKTTVENAKILKQKEISGGILSSEEKDIVARGENIQKENMQSMVAGSLGSEGMLRNTPAKAVESTLAKKAAILEKPVVSEVAKPAEIKKPMSTFEGDKTPEPVKTRESLFKKPIKENQSVLDKAEEEYMNTAYTMTHDGAKGTESISDIVGKIKTPVSNKVNIVDYLRTPKYVLDKIGLSKNAKELSNSYTKYLVELPKNLERITNWAKQVTPEGNVKIYQWLDGDKSIKLDPTETKVAGEVKTWLSEWADRLGMKKDERISDYITHTFPRDEKGEFDEEIAKLIRNKVPGSVYDPFLLARQGAEGYIQDTWKALDAYVKRATRKVHMDESLNNLSKASKDLETSQFNYVKNYADRINMRPTQLDTLIDNGVKNVIGYRLGARPTNTMTRMARKIVSRAKLGFSFSSAFKNLTQGVNTFAELGTKYTTKGYMDLFTKGTKELEDNGVLLEQMIEDKDSSAIKNFWEKFDKGTFFNFEATEKINRGAAYYGAKAKGLAQGMTEDQAINYGREIAGKTQFVFGSIDTPLALSSDIAKTAAQFQTFSLKQLEFIGEMIRNKKYASLARYVGAGAVIYGMIGSAFGMKWTDILPGLRFGTPPAFDLPVRAYKDITGAKDEYGNTPTVSSRVRDFGKAILTDVIPGGAQILKTAEGINTIKAGRSKSASGAFQYKVENTPGNVLRASIFGKSSLPESKKYYDKKNKKPTKSSSSNRFNPQ